MDKELIDMLYKIIKGYLYIELFAICACAFIFTLLFFGFIISKLLFGICAVISFCFIVFRVLSLYMLPEIEDFKDSQ